MKIGCFTGGHQKSSTGIGNYISNLIQNLPIPADDIYIIRHPTGYNYGIANQIVPWTPEWSNMMLWSWTTYIQKNSFKNLDLVHSPTLCLFPKKPHDKYVITVHDIIFKLHPEYCKKDIIRYTKIFFKTNLQFADKIITVSQATKNDVMNIYHIPDQKLVVIPEAASSKYKKLKDIELEIIRNKYNLPQKFILFVGTIEPRKNIPFLLQAFLNCLKSCSDITLVLAGGLGWNYDDVFIQIKKINITDKVRFLGYVPDEDLPALYNAARVFVFPSYYEGFGLPILEAMQCGTPVIASNTSSIPEVIGKEGMLVNLADIKEFSDKLIEIIQNDDLYSYQKNYGLQRSTLFTWESTAEQTYQVYKEVSNRL
jgi:glycosyltransferase involved in cell wall biosynthesis